VIHFAAYKAVGESVQKPLAYYSNNLGSLVDILRLLSIRGGSVVFSSSCTVYGQPDEEFLPVAEDAPMKRAESPYGNTKQICEEIIADTVKAASGEIKAISLRYFNPVGAHPSAHIGELPRGVPQNLLPFVTQTAAGLRGELKVFGDDYNTPDGSCIRDYIYVCDLAKAHVAAADRLLADDSDRDNLEIFNIGTGKGMSVLEVIDLFTKANGVEVPFSIAPRRAGDVEKVWADPSKANKLLGWRAETPFEDVMRSAWKWEKKIRGIE
jgi:UDP-glucose 4-epimerase